VHPATRLFLFPGHKNLLFVLVLVRNHLSGLRVVLMIVLMGMGMDHVPMTVLVFVNIFGIL